MSGAPRKAGHEVTTQLWSHRGVWLSVLAFSCIVNILMLTGSIFMMQVYDRVLTSGSVPTLIALSLIVLVLYIYYGFLEAVRARLLLRIGRSFEETLRNRVFDVVAMLALRRTPCRRWPAGAGHGDDPPVSGRAGALGFPRHAVGHHLPRRGLRPPSLAGHRRRRGCGADFHSRAPHRADNPQARGRSHHGGSRRCSHERGIAPQHRSDARPRHEGMCCVHRWAKEQQTALDASTLASDRGGIFGTSSRVLRLLVQSGMLALGAYLALLHEITPGTIIASSIIMSRGLAPIEQAVGNWQQFLGFRKATARLNAVLAAVPPAKDPMPLPPPRGLLEVENLTVMVQGNEKPLLQGLNFKVTPGTGLGVIGPTGAGKSTLSRVLVGVVEPARGSVRLDGATLDQRSEEDRGRHVGYLPQDVQLFDGTVAQNISRFSREPDAKAVVEAAQLANVHNMIMRLPQGYDTTLGNRGPASPQASGSALPWPGRSTAIPR
jgi:ABC-type protease/lipase transport system fused ATPase/permease subunit